MEGDEGGCVWDSSEKAFNMITAGTGTGKERRRGVAGEEEKGWRRPANIDKYFIPQHTESLRLVPRGREGERGEREREREREKGPRPRARQKDKKASEEERDGERRERRRREEERGMGQLRDKAKPGR